MWSWALYFGSALTDRHGQEYAWGGVAVSHFQGLSPGCRLHLCCSDQGHIGTVKSLLVLGGGGQVLFSMLSHDCVLVLCCLPACQHSELLCCPASC